MIFLVHGDEMKEAEACTPIIPLRRLSSNKTLSITVITNAALLILCRHDRRQIYAEDL